VKKKVDCPSCESKHVRFRLSKGFICIRCGTEWKENKREIKIGREKTKKS